MSSIQAPAIGVSSTRSSVNGSHRWDFVIIAVAGLLLAAVAFAPGLLATGHRLAPVTPLVIAHGILNTAWLLLFLAQTILIATGRRVLHTWLGVASVGLAAALVVVGYETAIAMTIRGFDLSGDLGIKADPPGNLVFPLGDLLTFTALLSAGLCFRHRPNTHRRLMLLATVGMMAPATLSHLLNHNFGPMPLVFLALLAFVFLSPALYDRLRFGRFQRLTVWGGLLLFAWGNIRATLIAPSSAWRHFAAWLIG